MEIDVFYNLRNFYLYPSPNGTLSCNNIRLSIFLIYAECAGWAALVWALVVLHRHRKHNGRIPALVIIVLLNTMLELLLNPYVITKLIQDDCHWDTNTTCRIPVSIWLTSAMFGVLLQQMTALESVLTWRYPSCSALLFSLLCSIVVYVIVFVCYFLCIFFGLLDLLLLSVIALIAINMISWIVVCRTPPNEHSFNRTKKPDCTLLAYATTTLIIYLIYSTLCIFVPSMTLTMTFLCLLSLSVIIDPPLCELVCKNSVSDTSPGLLSTEQEAAPADRETV